MKIADLFITKALADRRQPLPCLDGDAVSLRKPGERRQQPLGAGTDDGELTPGLV